MPAAVRSFPPIVADGARVLILGSMPGEASLAAGRYYAHPRNLFWPILGALTGAGPEDAYGMRVARLQQAGIALWDVIAECVRPGSLDARIRAGSVVLNPLPAFLARHPSITLVCCNGATADTLFRRHVLPQLATPPTCVRLPSTSPAHAALGLAAKRDAWQAAITPHLD
ncbi:DNA-deoxyinosine glycosylase [Luteimonas rhizosphaerae]|uniref:DNA-deoxyinosine glycosylase n=1 Tax=Luteimonas sp. 4-12 TaxID=2027406 RepID=UPI000C7D02FB|nr:DNA-deoxyinosine glycosylase [Luteimonas sp. 4-12]